MGDVKWEHPCHSTWRRDFLAFGLGPPALQALVSALRA